MNLCDDLLEVQFPSQEMCHLEQRILPPPFPPLLFHLLHSLAAEDVLDETHHKVFVDQEVVQLLR